MFDPEEAPQPALDAAAYDRLRTTLASRGAPAAIDELIADLQKAEDYQGVFYALLLKKRVELGVSPFPTGNATELPPQTHEAYEDAIRTAGRYVGGLLLERKEYAKAWAFFRLLGEPEPIRAVLEAYSPGPDDDVYSIIEITWQNGLLPKKGFDLVLDRHGICSAITMVSGSDLSSNLDLRDYCITKLAEALYVQPLRAAPQRPGRPGDRCPGRREHSANARGPSGVAGGRCLSHRYIPPFERGTDVHESAARPGPELRAQTLRRTAASSRQTCKAATTPPSMRATTTISRISTSLPAMTWTGG